MAPPINIDGTQITGASIDGTEVTAVTVDGTEVFSAIPDSVVAQYDALKLNLNDGDLVSTWPDEANSNDVTAGSAPTYRTNEINGNPAVDFGSGNNFLKGASQTISDPFTIFAVVRWDQTNLDDQDSFLSSAAGGNGFGFGDSTDNSFLRFGGRLNGNVAENNPVLLVGGEDSSGFVRRNGTETGTGSAGGQIIDGITIGRNEQAEAAHWLGSIGHIEIHDSLITGSDLTDRESTLADEWGITL